MESNKFEVGKDYTLRGDHPYLREGSIQFEGRDLYWNDDMVEGFEKTLTHKVLRITDDLKNGKTELQFEGVKHSWVFQREDFIEVNNNKLEAGKSYRALRKGGYVYDKGDIITVKEINARGDNVTRIKDSDGNFITLTNSNFEEFDERKVEEEVQEDDKFKPDKKYRCVNDDIPCEKGEVYTVKTTSKHPRCDEGWIYIKFEEFTSAYGLQKKNFEEEGDNCEDIISDKGKIQMLNALLSKQVGVSCSKIAEQTATALQPIIEFMKKNNGSIFNLGNIEEKILVSSTPTQSNSLLDWSHIMKAMERNIELMLSSGALPRSIFELSDELKTKINEDKYKMDIKDFKKENLIEAKKVAIQENNCEEIRVGIIKYKDLLGQKACNDAIIKEYSEKNKEVEKELAKFDEGTTLNLGISGHITFGNGATWSMDNISVGTNPPKRKYTKKKNKKVVKKTVKKKAKAKK